MYELKKNWKGIYDEIYWERALVLWKQNLPCRGLTNFEKHCSGFLKMKALCSL